MVVPAKRKATYQDVVDAPENMVAEIIDGDLYLFNRPKAPHAHTASSLVGDLVPPFVRGKDGPGGWLIMMEPELHLGTDIVVPDIAGWRRDRLPAVPDDAYLTLAPDWIGEVLSRRTEGIDRTKKLLVYAAAGVQHAWLVSAPRRTLEILHLVDGRWSLIAAHIGDVRVRAEPFDAIELDLGAIWADLVPTGTRASEAAEAYESEFAEF
jgi:Uma2 family endonuclease